MGVYSPSWGEYAFLSALLCFGVVSFHLILSNLLCAGLFARVAQGEVGMALRGAGMAYLWGFKLQGGAGRVQRVAQRHKVYRVWHSMGLLWSRVMFVWPWWGGNDLEWGEYCLRRGGFGPGWDGYGPA